QLLSDLGLHWGKLVIPCMITGDHEIHRAVAEITYPIEKDDRTHLQKFTLIGRLALARNFAIGNFSFILAYQKAFPSSSSLSFRSKLYETQAIFVRVCGYRFAVWRVRIGAVYSDHKCPDRNGFRRHDRKRNCRGARRPDRISRS